MSRVASRKVQGDGDFRKDEGCVRSLKIGFVGKRGKLRLGSIFLSDLLSVLLLNWFVRHEAVRSYFTLAIPNFSCLI